MAAMSRLPVPQKLVVDTNPAPLVQDSLYYKPDSPVSDDTPKKSKGTILISSVNKNEPIVTRRELWAYYCGLLPIMSPAFI
jgi:hypothetical protein